MISPVSARATAQAVGQRMHAKSANVLVRLEGGLPRIMTWWFVAAVLASALRIAVSPLHGAPSLETYLPYLLLVTAPLLSMALALHWFRNGETLPQPATRLAIVGRWRTIDAHEARAHRLYGTSGIMVSLLIGMMLNVPVRGIEYLVAIPPLPQGAPSWFSTLHFAMTFDVVVFGCLYMIAFVAALRRVPLFPRLLVAIWTADLAMQVITASLVANTNGLPAPVAQALHSMLDGNVKKTLISMALWLPYLLLSTRVNVTYRHRVPA
jgi:hypothetical protein